MLNATGAGTKYPTDGCEGDCAAPAFKYECDGTKCVENATGTYVTVDCDKKCAAPPAAYACTGAACVATLGGNKIFDYDFGWYTNTMTASCSAGCGEGDTVTVADAGGLVPREQNYRSLVVLGHC